MSIPEHSWRLIRTGDAFAGSVAKAAFMKAFVNRRYEMEGDLHVWHGDHIEWSVIAAVLGELGLNVIESSDYQSYRPSGGQALCQRYRVVRTGTKYVFARKHRQPAASGALDPKGG